MGAYTLLQDLTVATNSTSVVLNNFGTITKDDFIKVVTNIKNTTSNTNLISLFANSSTTATDYHEQTIQASGSNVFSGRNNISLFDDMPANNISTTIAYIKLSENDRFNYFTNNTRDDSGGIHLLFNYNTSSGATFSSGITTLTFTGNQTNGIGTGSRIQIYKLAAEKVRDIIVENNSTQVDIPTTGIFDPAIDKDSEYLLVSEIIGNFASAHELMVNDNTTSTNYYRQDIQGVATTTAADRGNTALYVFTELNQRTLAYTHIKLSNIGAYTSQSYGNRNIGTSSVRLQNFFGSSTAENITSITKLNIRAAVTSAIGAGSRFTLYKLYE